MHISSISFTANERNSQAEIENKKKKVGEAAVGTSAVAAAGNRAGFKMFKSTKKWDIYRRKLLIISNLQTNL